MTIASFDPTPGDMPGMSSPQPVQISSVGLAGELATPDGATTLALFAHPTAAGRDDPGHRFMGDVLRANGVATLSIGLRTAEEEARRAPLDGAPLLAARLQGVLAWLGEHGPTRRLQVALVGVNEAAAPCVLAAREPGFEAIRSLVLLDGRLDLSDAEVAAWRQPTLCIAGRHGMAHKGQPPGGASELPAPHRLVMLPMQTQPRASSGAFQAMACQVVAWLRQRHPIPREPAPVASTELASAQ